MHRSVIRLLPRGFGAPDLFDLLLAAGVGAEKPVQRDVHGAVVAVEVFVVEPGRSSRVSALVCIVTTL